MINMFESYWFYTPGSLRAKHPTIPLLMKSCRNCNFCSGVPTLFIIPAYRAL